MGIVQTGIVTNRGEPTNKNEDYSMKKTKITPTRNSYHDQRGRPSLIGNAHKLLTSG
jgi:hypothetical protein